MDGAGRVLTKPAVVAAARQGQVAHVTPRILAVTLNTALDMLAVMPRLEVDGVNRSEWLGVFPGGKGVNVAKAARLLGAEVTATGFVGAGPLGRALREALAERDIADAFVEVEGDTRPTFVVYDRERGAETIINHPGQFTLRAADWDRLKETVAREAARHDWVALSGSLPEGVSENAYTELIELIHAAGGRAALDSSGAALAAGLAARPDLVKPTVAELLGDAAPHATERETIACARELQEGGVGVVIVSRGAGGVFCLADEPPFAVSAPPVDVVSTLGAGDALVAGVTCGLAAGESLRDAVRRGVAAGTSSVQRMGAGECRRDEVEYLLPDALATPLAGP